MNVLESWKDKALSITGSFEGKGFDQVTGDFDGMGISLGILQWNLGMGSLQEKILRPFLAVDPIHYFDWKFPVNCEQLPFMAPKDALAFCRRHMLVGTRLKPEWEKAWREFLLQPQVITLQKKACEKLFDRAEVLAENWDMHSERAFCWFFDILTQNGGMRGIEKPRVTGDLLMRARSYNVANRAIWGTANLSEEQQVLLIATMLRAEVANPKWAQDVSSRKGTIAVGTGIVHGTRRSFTFDSPSAPALVAAPKEEFPNQAPQGPRISYSRCQEILRANGCDLTKLNLLAIRGYYLDSMGLAGSNDRGIYDDALIWVAPDALYAVQANVDPSRVRKGSGTGAGKGMASLKDGRWPGYFAGMHKAGKPTGHPAFRQGLPVTVVRDGINGPYEDTGMFGINVHRGANNSTSSEGCLTVRPNLWTGFKSFGDNMLKQLKQKQFDVLLVDEIEIRDGRLKVV